MKLPGPMDSTAGYIILGIVLAFAINQGIGLLLSTDMPIVAVESNSMVPTFYRGDILLLHGLPAEDIAVGDIIVFSPVIGRSDMVPIVHRVIEKNPDGTFQTRGDANPGQLDFEKHIYHSQIHGKVFLILPYLGWVKIGITEYILPNIIPIALVILLAYLAFLILRKI
ncbi:MAG: signal peptidase I [Candidatus Aenigmatarchaeota archaeon]|mgnify:CR=1 FL=1|nr:MAG: signal peptidase I [Candidatus Aenigmarchaeota archaeon]